MPDEDKTGLVEELLTHDRVVIEASLVLANGSFFQPTGFPDIGACVFVDKDGRRRCLVESEQSLANRLEAVCMQAPGTWRAPFHDKLPVIRVVDGSGGLLATNLTEPHRLSSSYVLEGTLDNNTRLQDVLRIKLGVSEDGKRWPLDKRTDLSRVVFALDPAAILHGFQFMQWSAVGLRQQRLLHARMEAVLAGDSDVHYGMVKVDAIEPESSSQKMGNKGQSIAHKARLVPESIRATFEIDLLGLRERRLVGDKPATKETKGNGGAPQESRVEAGPAAKPAADEVKGNGDRAEAKNREAQEFLLALALWKIRQFLADQPAFDPRTGQVERSLRLRSDCALRCSGIVYRTQSNGSAFSDDQPLAVDRLVKVENNTIQALVAPPDFKPHVRGITEQESLEIIVTYAPTVASKSQEPPTAPRPDGGDDENDENDSDE